MKPHILNIVAFCSLMESTEGIVGKSPDYIMEKFERYVMSEREDEAAWGLDSNHKTRLHIWRKKWDKSYKALNDLQQ